MQEINGHAIAMGQAAAHQDDTNADMEMIRRDLDEVSLAAQAVWGGQAKAAFAGVASLIDGNQTTNRVDGEDIAEQTRYAQANYIGGDADSADLLKTLLA